MRAKPDTYYALGLAYANLGDIGNARQQFVQALSLRPDFAMAREPLHELQ